MRALVERVLEARVEVEGEVVGRIGEGLLVYLGVEDGDGAEDMKYIVDKVRHLRIFEDEAGKMNLDVSQKGGQVLAISAFTLQADARKGRRPSFDRAGDPAVAKELYLEVVDRLREAGLTVATGQFAATMAVTAVNDGPITVLLDSRKMF
jgi:D-tyrosyl-tRNA(Tyr) deacylase